MAIEGGRTPWDPTAALTGPARTLYAPPDSPLPVDGWSVVPPKNTGGEYPAQGVWKDFGLAADAPSYTHSKETEGLEYQQPAAVLFEQLSNITRTFTAQIAGIDPETMAIVENTQVAPELIAAGPNKSAQDKLSFGLYDNLLTYRIAMVTYRPSGAALVTEPDGTLRPPAVILVLPLVTLSSEDSEFSFERGTPVNAPITFTVIPDPTITDPRSKHGFWIFERAGVIAAV